MYKPSPGRMNMPKTGRGIPSAFQMSPLNEKNFPVKPGMKFESFEQVLDKKTGKLVDSSLVTNAAKGTDLSRYEGLTNISQVRSASGNDPSISGGADGMATEAIVNRRVNKGRTNDPNKVSKVKSSFLPVNTQSGLGTTTDKNGIINESTDYSLKQLKDGTVKRKKSDNTDRTMGQLQGISTGYLDAKGQFGDTKQGRLGSILTDQTRTNDGEDLYTTARITSSQDATNFRNNMLFNSDDQYASRQRGNEMSNLTQNNKNFNDVFTLGDIQKDVAKYKNKYYYTGDGGKTRQGRQILDGGTLAENRQDDYEHLDLSGALQGPNTRRNFNSGTRFGSKSKKGTRQDSRSTTYSGNMTRG